MSKKTRKGLRGAVPGDMQQPSRSGVDLIDQGDVVVAFAPLDLVHPDRFDAAQAAVAQAVIDHRPHGREDGVPTGPERLRGLLPAQPPRPPGQEQLVGLGLRTLPLGPGHAFDLHPATRAPHPAHPVAEIDLPAEDRNELEQPRLLRPVVAGSARPAARTDRTAVGPRLDVDDQKRNGRLPSRIGPIRKQIA